MADPKGLLIVPVGFRTDGTIHALELDNSDRLKVIVDSVTGSLTVQQTDPASLLVGTNGWDGSAWQKLQVDSSKRLKVLLDAVTGSVPISANDNTFLGPVGGIAALTNTSLPAGTSHQSVFTVPAGQRYILNAVSYSYTGTIAGVYLDPNIYDGVNRSFFGEVNPVVSSKLYSVYVDLVIEAGQSFVLSIFGATLNDDCQAYAFYRRVK